jgi:signal transduction histidine kinase
MKGEFEVALKKARSPMEYESTLRSGLEEADKITRLADNLLLLASVESRKIIPERKDLDLSLLIHGAVNTARKLAELKKIRVSITGQEKITVKGDEQQLKQLFFNLLDNAVKYTGENGNIKVSLDTVAQDARIAIEDTGIGMTAEQSEHIFDRFYRADKSRTERGFGLGMSIVKSVADAHGGRVEVKTAPHSGTTFTVYLPLSGS